MQIAWDNVWALANGAADKPSAAEEAALVADCVSGDPNAFETLVRLHQHCVFRLAGRFFRRREDVEDAAQETFLTAWRKLATYRGDAPLEHWLTRVCLNTCYQKIRSSKPESLPLDEHVDSPVSSNDPSAGIDVERLLGKLQPKDRFMLLLLDGEGWSVREIAERLGWSAVNVKVRAHRARARLRRMVEEERV